MNKMFVQIMCYLSLHYNKHVASCMNGGEIICDYHITIIVTKHDDKTVGSLFVLMS